MREKKITWGEPPSSNIRLDDCEWYHIMEVPGLGLTDGIFDCRKDIDNILGNLDFKNKKVLNLGPITGYLNFMKPDKSRKLSRILQKPISYTTELIKNTHDDIRLHHGNYVGVHGPNYETHSEIALFKSMGASAVGMSTIPEIETAVKNNVKVTAISIITNVYGKTVDLGHEGVVQAAKNASEKLARLLCLN
jgi:hypothetical protein